MPTYVGSWHSMVVEMMTGWVSMLPISWILEWQTRRSDVSVTVWSVGQVVLVVVVLIKDGGLLPR